MKQLFIGLIAEGTTDVRFLKHVIYRSIVELSFRCETEIDVFDIQEVEAEGDNFVEKMVNAAYTARQSYSLNALCVHCDSDDKTTHNVMRNKINPLMQAITGKDDDEYCKCIIPTIPVQMIESWMLADKPLLKRLIDAQHISDTTLGIDKAPEAYADPKAVINNAIRVSSEGKSRRRRDQIKISDLYGLLGNALELEKLRTIASFCNFEDNVMTAFKQLKLLR